ncbi:MAG: hybrid sensor histidine kinase/response regulator, partial [Planctomycetes bacterium]|nr:hybrid sensor histidine kinase/response regulator [Planctomycetota bacterium]
ARLIPRRGCQGKPDALGTLLGDSAPRPATQDQPVYGRRRDGKQVPVECRLSTFENGERFTIAAVRDVSDRHALEERLRATQRMESIGRLAGGIAHDFNNILAVIVSYGGFVKEGVPPGSQLAEDLDEVLAAAGRASALTGQLLAFSRRQIIEVRRTDLNELIASLSKMLERILGEDVTLTRIAGEGLWPVQVDQSQIEQVLLNLCLNGRDAMPEGGHLTVETAAVLLDESYTRQHPEVEPGPYVALAVSDTGAGMDEE